MIDQIIGVDCATDPKKVGIAVARSKGGLYVLHTAAACSKLELPADLVAAWVNEVQGSTLVALDAPLGWPKPMGLSLASHAAGLPLPSTAHAMFRRQTDVEICRRFGKTPLDVGADRIARTAHWALTLLEQLRSMLNESIELAWDGKISTRVAAIEVYPAATLLGHGVRIQGYKASDGHVQRAAIHDLIQQKLAVPAALEPITWSIDTLDASVCVLAGIDFLSGESVPPDDAELARKEGWIWAPPRASS